MKVPLSWLRELTPVEATVEELAATLADLGLAVESVRHAGHDLAGVVVARVLDVAPIAGADRIRAVRVDAGRDGPVEVVCGAWNFQPGDLVPLATVGTRLPNGMAIARRRMKGALSEGMLCAPDELGLPGGHDGILVLAPGPAPGDAVGHALGLGPDVVLDLEVNPNRPDALSMLGVARDLAARLGLPLHPPEPVVAEGPVAAGDLATVAVEAPELCGRFVVRVLEGVEVGPSPPWLARRLELSGMRAINNVVDASNYVMLELGQPNHPYDLARLPGRGLRVRRAREAERLVTLDDVERTLGTEDLLICDSEDDPVGIAGVMGGAAAEIGPDTVDVLLEAAWFQPMAVARTSRRLGLRTEASARFERGCDPEAIGRAAARFCQLVQSSGGGAVAAGSVDVAGHRPVRTVVRVRPARVNGILGTDLGGPQMMTHLETIGFSSAPAGDGAYEVTVPSFRPDTSTEVDVAEEVARLHGYRAIAPTVPPAIRPGGLTPRQRDRRLVRRILAGTGASEAWSATFVSPADLSRCGIELGEALVVANPLVDEDSRLRPSMLPGLLGAMVANARHRAGQVALFEVGHVFGPGDPADPLPRQTETLAVAVSDRDALEATRIWRIVADGLGVAGVAVEAATAPGLHPGRTARLRAGGIDIGVLGEVDPGVLESYAIEGRVAWLEVDLGPLLGRAPDERPFRAVSRFPSSDVDLAFEVDEATPAADVEATLRGAGSDLVVDVALFDVYRGPPVAAGRRSLAYRVRFQAGDHTMAEDEVAEARARLIEAVRSAHPATLRG